MITRGPTHRIDTLAVRAVIAQLPADWLVRNLEERDYGIDMLLEFFSDEKATGKVALVQVKGTEKAAGANPTLSAFPVRTLLYAEMFSHPFFVFHVSLKDNSVHFVWLQKYIKTVLNPSGKKWRKQASLSIKLPSANTLKANKNKILEVADTYKRYTSGLVYLAQFEWLKIHTDAVLLKKNIHAVPPALKNIKCIEALEEFIEFHMATQFELCIEDLKCALIEIRDSSEWSEENIDIIETQMNELYLLKMTFLDEDEMDEFAAASSDTKPY